MTGPFGNGGAGLAPRACPVCGQALRQLDHASKDRLDAFVCVADDYAWYGPRALDAARERHGEILKLAEGTRGGVALKLLPDTHCPVDGRKDVCSKHRFMNRGHYADLVLQDEFGRKIAHHVGRAAKQASAQAQGDKERLSP